ncbi:hypothetical protein JBE27_00320 [Streptomyces albiflaviniger]|nr:hypothetical protein [Streptomyces albiflaviniger]
MPAAGLPLRRLTEVEPHHADLGIGRTVADLPATFVESRLTVLTGTRFAGHPDIPPPPCWAGSPAVRTAPVSPAPTVLARPARTRLRP